jgi:hypothetical protein
MNEFCFFFNVFCETIIYMNFQKFELIIDMCLFVEALTNRELIYQNRFDLNHNLNHAFIETILKIFIINTSCVEQFN